MIATASRPESAAWCRERGADLVVDYRDLKGNLAQHGIEQVDYILCLNDTDGHWPAMAELVAPLGHICTIVENAQPLDQNALKLKSAALHWEFMFTRSMFTTPDIAQQGKILQQMAQLLDEGKLSTTLSETPARAVGRHADRRASTVARRPYARQAGYRLLSLNRGGALRRRYCGRTKPTHSVCSSACGSARNVSVCCQSRRIFGQWANSPPKSLCAQSSPNRPNRATPCCAICG